MKEQTCVILHKHVCVRACVVLCRSEDSLQDSVLSFHMSSGFLSSVWVLGIKLMSAGMVASSFTHWAILPAPVSSSLLAKWIYPRDVFSYSNWWSEMKITLRFKMDSTAKRVLFSVFQKTAVTRNHERPSKPTKKLTSPPSTACSSKCVCLAF